MAVAQFKGYPLWPVRIVSITNQKESTPKFIVFCYGSHDFQTVVEANLLSYSGNYAEASKKTAKGVNHAFRECESSPDLYYQFLKKKTAKGAGADLTASSETSAIRNQVTLAQDEVTKLKFGLVKEIEKKVQEKVVSVTGVAGSSQQAALNPELIVSEIYDSITLEYNVKFEKIEKLFSSLDSQIQSLELRVATIEEKLDDYEQERLLDSLVFFGVKQDPGNDLGTTVLDIVKRMGVNVQKEQLLSVNRFRLPNAARNIQTPTTVAPVLVKFATKDTAYNIFRAKSKLAKSGVFVTEYLTKMKKAIFEGARNRYGVKNVWSDRGRVYKREQGDSHPTRICSLVDTL